MCSVVNEVDPVPLSTGERGVLAGLIRMAIRKSERSSMRQRAVYGHEYDPTRHEDKVALLEGVYRKLGGDPSQITNRVGMGD